MIKIDTLDHNGKGIGKLNDKIVFVRNALPNEIVEINIVKEKKNYMEATVSKYIKLSKSRIKSNCPYFNKCGGCDLLHMTYTDQLNFKQQKIENITNKYLNKNIKINRIIESDNNFNYRNKVTFQVNGNIGFFENKTHEIIKIDNCMLCDKKINESIKYLNKLNLKNINQIICKTNSVDLMIIIDSNESNIDISEIKKVANSIYLKTNNEFKLLYGNKYILEELENYKYLVSPNSFFQTNLNVCTKLYKKIKENIPKNSNVLDLYCGTGSIGIFVNDNNKLIGIELNKSAINDANKNKTINNLNNIKFICGDSENEINKLDFKPDVIIIDPPRAGITNKTINNLLKLSAKTIIYVSCDPMTMVRDLNLLSNNYKIEEITPFDMFPNTRHVECICILNSR